MTFWLPWQLIDLSKSSWSSSLLEQIRSRHPAVKTVSNALSFHNEPYSYSCPYSLTLIGIYLCTTIFVVLILCIFGRCCHICSLLLTLVVSWHGKQFVMHLKFCVYFFSFVPALPAESSTTTSQTSVSAAAVPAPSTPEEPSITEIPVSAAVVPVTFREIVGCPVRQHGTRANKLKVSHASLITSSPYKNMLLDAKKIKEDKEKKQRENRRTVRRNLAVEKSRSGKNKNKTTCQKKKERITRIIQKITPHDHIVEIVTTVLKMKSQKMIGCLCFM